MSVLPVVAPASSRDDFRPRSVTVPARADSTASPASALRRAGRNLSRRVRSVLRRLHCRDDGMSTVEYAIGTLAAAAFAAVLYTVISGDSIVTALTGLVQRALSVTF